MGEEYLRFGFGVGGLALSLGGCCTNACIDGEHKVKVNFLCLLSLIGFQR